MGSQYYDNADNEYTKVDLPQFRSPTNNGLPMFGFPKYTNTMVWEDNTFMRDTYMPDMRGMGTREMGSIKADIELPKSYEPRVDPIPRMSDHEDERKLDYDYTRKVRPSMLQKLVKKFDGSGDPYDHITTFRQVVRAEKVSDNHTQIEGFGLTLEGKALSWFQTLETSTSPKLRKGLYCCLF